jgi:hypothetical protein
LAVNEEEVAVVKIGALALSCIAALSGAAALCLRHADANAVPYQGNAIYRVGNSLLVSAPVGQRVTIRILGGRIRTLSRAADACGVVSFSLPDPLPPSNYLVINGQGVDLAATVAAGVQSIPVCNSTTLALSEPRPNDFVAQNVGSTGRRYYSVGHTPGAPVTIEYAANYTANRNPNACGFVQIRSTANLDLGAVNAMEVTVGEGQTQTVNFSELPAPPSDYPPFCRRTGGTSTPYVPLSW